MFRFTQCAKVVKSQQLALLILSIIGVIERTMKFLHTADWHLGQVFYEHSRGEEHRRFLDWLITVLQEHQIELFLHAGDIFDHPNPSHEAIALFLQFLTRVATETEVRRAIWIAGNHDSIAFFHALAPIVQLQSLRTTVVAHTTIDESPPIFQVDNCLIAAIPYLRERDLLPPATGLEVEERERRFAQAVYDYYRHIGALLASRQSEIQGPVIGMGHLFVHNAQLGGSERIPHVGKLGGIPFSAFTEVFDYVALGHIHRYQRVSIQPPVAYSGSPFPLSFAEVHNPHGVIIGEWDSTAALTLQFLPTPPFRPLILLEGTVAEILDQLEERLPHNAELTPWVGCKIVAERLHPDTADRLKHIAQEHNAELLYLQLMKASSPEQFAELLTMDLVVDLQPEKMFKAFCATYEGLSAEEQQQLYNYFQQALDAITTADEIK